MDATALAIDYVPATEIEPHPDNPRRGDVDAIHQSVKRNGVYQPVIVQRSTGHILVGNHRYRAMLRAGLAEIPVIWRDVNDDEARRIMLADNRTSDRGDYDTEQLVDVLQELGGDLDGTGYALADLEAFEAVLLAGQDPEPSEKDHGENEYTRRIAVPQYEPTGDRPEVKDLTDDAKVSELVERIAAADIPDDVARFLIAAAQRHRRFDFARIAEFYAHADATVQELMEESALVIIDFDDAIHHGYVRLSERLEELLEADRADGLEELVEQGEIPAGDL